MKHVIDSIHHLFVPKESNNFRSKLLHHDFLTVYLVFAILLSAGVTHIQNNSGSILGYATDISTQKLFDLTNAERAKANLSPLEYNAKLEKAALKKAENMFTQQYWAHYGPAGETPWQFILESGYQYEFAGENLAKNFLFSDGVVSAWMDSTTHRENILRSEYTDVGFGIANGVLNGEETTLVVQMFGAPLYKPVANKEPAPPAEEKAAAPLDAPAKVAALPPSGVLAEQKEMRPAFYSIFVNVNMIFIAILVMALLLDIYFATKLNLIHIKGKNLIHVFFLLSIAAGSYFIIKGSVL